MKTASPLAGLALVLASAASLPTSTAPAVALSRLLSGSIAWAEEPCPDSAEEGVRRGVQRRDFLKRLRVETSAWAGFMAGDLVSSSYAYGGAVGFYPFEDLGVEASLVVTSMYGAIERPLAGWFGGHAMRPSVSFTLVGNLVWAPIHFKLRFFDRYIVHGDLAVVLGAGDTIHSSVQGLTFDAGLGLKIYLHRWVALRFDLRDYIMAQELLGVQRITNNLVGTLGVSVFLPGPRPPRARPRPPTPAKTGAR